MLAHSTFSLIVFVWVRSVMCVFRYCLILSLFVLFSGCSHRDEAFKNQFELIGDQDVIPEPIDHSSQIGSLKDSGFRFGLSESFSSQETVGWRTSVSHAIRPSRHSIDSENRWDTTYTHALHDDIRPTLTSYNPVEVYRRTGQWPLRYSLDTGDRLRVIVYSQRTLTRTYTVDDSGYISVPLVGQVRARGASTKKVQQRIAAKLRAKYLRDPKVSVEVATYRPFFVLGQVQTAGQYPYVVGMTAEVAAAIAGGFTSRANERKFRISRVYNGRRYTLLVSKNFPIFPGDTVYVRERFF